jgi:pimeloyl-ACP methyl ester carboxylesterase
MKRVTFRNSRGLKLVGLLSSAGFDSIVILAHGFGCDKSSHGRFDALAKMYNEAGFDTLAFDFAGTGESALDYVTAEKEVDDLKSAIAYVKCLGYTKIILHGYSLGALICLRAYEPSISTMILVGALTGPIQLDLMRRFSQKQFEELKEKGWVTVPVRLWPPRAMFVDRKMIEEIEALDPNELFRQVRCPILIVHGNADDVERAFLENTKKGLGSLPKGSKVEIIDGARHGFFGHYRRLMELSTRWVKDHAARV